MAFVKFWADASTNFDASKAQSDTLYFIIDTGELYKGNVLIADKSPSNLPNPFGFNLYANGGTEPLHVYDGSSPVNLKAGAFVQFTENPDGTITINSADSNTTYTLSGSASGNTWVTTLTPSSGTATTSIVPAMKGATSSAAGAAGLVPGASSANRNKFLRGDGTWQTPTNTTYSDMTGATADAAGTHGLVPAPAAGKQTSFLRGDGTWVVPTDNDTKNTAGSTNSSKKLYLIGAESQATNPQTYSHDTAYVGTDGFLYSGSKKVATEEYVTSTFSTAMVFKGTLGTGGTITTLPTASADTVGDTYKVITAGTYANIAAKVGDVFTCSNAPAWVLVPSGDEPSGTVTNIATGTGLSGGPITTSGTISLKEATTSALGGVKIGSNITVNSGTISLSKANITNALGYTPPTTDTNTTYTIESGDANGQIKVTPSGGTAYNVNVTGLAAAAYKAVTDSTSASAISTGANLVTERDIYYGLPKINNSNSYTRSTTIYAPTAGGTANYVLIGAGTTSAPTWTAQSNLSVGSATKATQDASGNVITTTYATKTSVETVEGYLTWQSGAM